MAGLLDGGVDDEFTPVNSFGNRASNEQSRDGDSHLNVANSMASKPTTSAGAPGRRGAFGMMSRAADEMAAKVAAAEEIEKQLLSGTQIIELDPDQLEASFVVDRLDDDDDSSLQELIQAIAERGQNSPILVRPIPGSEGRFQIVFGHRRAKAAKALGIKVNAAVRQLSDQEHVIAQGQENTARADLSFIERALFARKLAEQFDNVTIMSSLAINKTVLSKLQSVTTNIPETVIYKIGAARGVGRDRWYDLSILLKSSNIDGLEHLLGQDKFKKASSADRFLMVFNLAKKANKTASPKKLKAVAGNCWAPKDKSVSIITKSRPKDFSLVLTEREAKPFGEWISNNLGELYEAFRKSKQEN
ncbi:plasmid partitioning protein RepB [Mesorhizobium sp.]|uniref:plasmid partitioning protein RepB n=1 Tax=Mesorhizobium sp. TaxID=1871066 RepID=UPI000FE32518|nr:plasmid partitioning protein RepB [Mesorhizobium sp.]RWN51519.1 MAG: plasmid partitioning protein RepB [Mesorhizobium sp.]RWN72160.1 MAG: plasmid partitioning protein RepB [Mesorhizobium sp.]RWN73381.1 MAG: plasmid partitioning protein RepB [Mesorhizobium sp.]RWN85692.1 MAG: plasmid partitioning protein RepB [Mesorhizobium sp.]RWO09422.1 MAG: plasmid partitioning protein RepB [Mesorhizobium sp.]